MKHNEFTIGCNYWDSAHGTDMWKYFDSEVIDKDMKALSSYGVKYLRVFPNWRDFQPIKLLYGCYGAAREYVIGEDEVPYVEGTSGIDQKQIENFITFANICDKYGIKLIVAIVTGWMSGRMYVPPILEGKDLISDPEALMWTERFVKGFVNGVKHCKNILMWDLGNEYQCLQRTESRAAAFTWMSLVTNTIKACDNTREIASGTPSLQLNPVNIAWTISDQGELLDYVTPHPYISPSTTNDIDIMTAMRTTVYPTAQCVFYSDIAGIPAVLQEQGTFTTVLGHNGMAAEYARVNMLSSLANNVKGWFWWCAFEQNELDFAPYRWVMIERTLGMLNADRSPKPVADSIKSVSELVDKLPFDTLPERDRDAVCILSRGQNKWLNAAASFILSKQAGFELRFADSDKDLPISDTYLMPCINGWEVCFKKNWDFLKTRVKENGATLYISFDGGQVSEFEEVMGIRSLGVTQSHKNHIGKFSFGEVPYKSSFEIAVEPITAKVLATDENGNPILTKNQYGKGCVYFLNAPMEISLSHLPNAYNDTNYYKVYKEIFGNIIENRILNSNNPQIGVTLHKVSDTEYIATAINYSAQDQKTEFILKDGWNIETVYGNFDTIPKCDGAIYILKG